MAKIEQQLQEFQAQLASIARQLNLENQQQQLQHYQDKMQAGDFWQSPQAQSISRSKATLEQIITAYQKLESEAQDLLYLVQSATDTDQTELEAIFYGLQTQLDTFKDSLKFNQPYDDYPVIIEILAGAGGTDAQDWVQMLLRMYLRWADSKSIRSELVSQSAGEEAGYKHVSFRLWKQPLLYGQLKGEHGVHRLVRLSPFNAQNLRQTSFARVEVLPVLEESQELEVPEADLRFDFFKSSGHGGQSVNTTDSAVRVTHLPTKISVSVQNERSQMQNKTLALTILHSKLLQLQLESQTQTLTELKGVTAPNEWGSQIRNYVLHPYKQVKDLRSNYVSSQAQQILDGDLDGLIQAYSDIRLNLDK